MKSLRDFYLFEALDDEAFERLEKIAKKSVYRKGSILFYEKDIPASLHILTEGIVKIYKSGPKTNEVVIRRLHAPTLIAEMAVLEQIPYPASASFETDGSVISIDFDRFKREFMDDPRIAFAFVRSLSRKIRNLEEMIELNIVLDTTARLAKYLYENEEVLGTLKNYKIAESLNMTPETLSRTLKKFSVLELLEKGADGYLLKNREGLRVFFE